MMQQPQMVPPQAQAMKPVLSSNVVSSADMNKLQEMLRMMGDDQLKPLVNRPYPVGTLAGLEVSTRNRAKLAAEARAAAGSNKNIIQQDIEQLALSKMRENIANDERMGLPNVVNQMEQNPAMMAASGGMVEGYSGEDNDPLVGRDAEEELKKFKAELRAADRKALFKLPAAAGDILSLPITAPLELIDRTPLLGRAGRALFDTETLNPFGGITPIYDTLFRADDTKTKLDSELDSESAPPGTVSPSTDAGTEKRSPYSISPVRDEDGNLIADPNVSKIGGDSDIRLIDTSNQTFDAAKEAGLASLNEARKLIPKGDLTYDTIDAIDPKEQFGGKTFGEALRQRRLDAGLGDYGEAQLERGRERADRRKGLAGLKSNLELVKAGEDIMNQRGRGAIGTIASGIGALTKAKLAKEMGIEAADSKFEELQDSIDLKRDAIKRNDVEAEFKYGIDIANKNLAIARENTTIKNQQQKDNKTLETSRAAAEAQINLKSAELEVEFAKLNSLDDYRQIMGEASKLQALAKSGSSRKDLLTLQKNTLDAFKNFLETADLTKEQRAMIEKKYTELNNLMFMQSTGMSFGNIAAQIKDEPDT